MPLAVSAVSGGAGRALRAVVRYEAPLSAQVALHMDQFLAWFESTRPTGAATSGAAVNGIARAALVHLWFESIHPFKDGNGRLGRALADMALAQDMHAQDRHTSHVLVRVYGMPRQMLESLLEAGHVRSGGGFLGGLPMAYYESRVWARLGATP